MKTKDILQLIMIAGIAYAVYKLYSQLKQATAPAASAIADFYSWLSLPPNMVVNGDVVLPDGSTVPLSLTDVRQNGGNLVVAAYEGHFYQLFPHDSDGNWPSVLIR